MPAAFRTPALAVGAIVAWGAAGCHESGDAPPLAHTESVVRSAPVPAENGPKLGVVAEQLVVREATDRKAPSFGILSAGALVARSEEAVSRAGCEGGWYAINPRGFVCTSGEATLDLAHPTLAVMALRPKADAALPYTYARARTEAPLFERDTSRPDAVREVGKIRRRAGMAVVGSWKAKDPTGAEARLALLTSGRFVKASDLEAARPSDFAGVELSGEAMLPMAFVVKRGVRSFRIDDRNAEKGDLLEYHSHLNLTGRFRSLGRTKYWAVTGPQGASDPEPVWVRHQDVTVVQRRSSFPDFVTENTRWLDVSVITDTLTAYEGKRPVFVTLVSVARDLPSTGSDTQLTGGLPRAMPLGTFTVKQKSLTFLGRDQSQLGEAYELWDVPWAIELSSGQLLHGAYWHDRFGIEQGAGSVALSPADASRLFRFVAPELPNGWHAATASGEPTRVVIRK